MSRRPRGTRWTYKELKAITPDWKGETIADGDNLFGNVRVGPDGGIFIPFRFGYRWEGKKQWFYAGSWPSVDMAERRARRNKAREDYLQGINPKDRKVIDEFERKQLAVQTIKEAEKSRVEGRTVENLFDAWIKNGVARKND
ncbi:MAG: Arm DNA-binding domain-containing protein, partial [Castellaniella sp.]|uniref:Arm DNA-binding domain-containing protein n=1 Tax=Castellaniella sp. TaxID=1955812 RepID=UPI003A8693D2